MNRLEFQEKINERLPLIKEQYSQRCDQCEKFRRSFVKTFPVTRIFSLTIDEYVIGKQSKSSFCYRVEIEMDRLGRIKGANSSKFGVWYGTQRGARRGYQFVSKFGKTVAEAFENVKTEISNLLIAGQEGDWETIKNSKISPMYKGKLLHIYYPDKYMSIYSKGHLEHFAINLDIDVDGSCVEDLRKSLLEYLNSFKILQNESMLYFMWLLYDIFGYPSDNDEQAEATAKEELSYPLLGNVIPSFIDELPLGIAANTGEHSGKTGSGIDFLKKNKAQKRLGDRGETIVLKAERKRLSDLGQERLAKKIKHVSQDNNSAGYDILSFDEDGTPRYIEVKATANKTICDGFYITNNELMKSQELQNYFLYFVLAARSTEPLIFPLAQPNFRDNKYVIEPVNYYVTLKA